MLTTIIIVPMFNEESRLDLDRFLSYRKEHPSVCFLFVDDGSVDGSAAMVERFCQLDENGIRLHRLDRNRGKAEAVRRGMVEALTSPVEFIGFWDADLATPLEELTPMLELLRSEPHVMLVTGARVKLLGRNIDRNPLRHYIGRVFATMVSVTLGLGIYDTQCGAKVFRAGSHLDQVLAEPFLSRWIFDVEVIARLLGVRSRREDVDSASLILEYPLRTWVDIKGSKLKPTDVFKAALDLLRIYQAHRHSLR